MKLELRGAIALEIQVEFQSLAMLCSESLLVHLLVPPFKNTYYRMHTSPFVYIFFQASSGREMYQNKGLLWLL